MDIATAAIHSVLAQVGSGSPGDLTTLEGSLANILDRLTAYPREEREREGLEDPEDLVDEEEEEEDGGCCELVVGWPGLGLPGLDPPPALRALTPPPRSPRRNHSTLHTPDG
jgi:hypothetical protein